MIEIIIGLVFITLWVGAGFIGFGLNNAYFHRKFISLFSPAEYEQEWGRELPFHLLTGFPALIASFIHTKGKYGLYFSKKPDPKVVFFHKYREELIVRYKKLIDTAFLHSNYQVQEAYGAINFWELLNSVDDYYVAEERLQKFDRQIGAVERMIDESRNFN